jgi:hypothetical protein
MASHACMPNLPFTLLVDIIFMSWFGSFPKGRFAIRVIRLLLTYLWLMSWFYSFPERGLGPCQVLPQQCAICSNLVGIVIRYIYDCAFTSHLCLSFLSQTYLLGTVPPHPVKAETCQNRRQGMAPGKARSLLPQSTTGYPSLNARRREQWTIPSMHLLHHHFQGQLRS